MIKLIIKWLWDFNHVHKWKYKATHHTHFCVMGLESDRDELVYECECGEIVKL